MRRTLLALPLFGLLAFLGLADSVGQEKTAPKKQPEAKKKAPGKPPTATPAESLKVAKGFKVELLYTVPQNDQGSWVNLCVDPKGRLIVSDQYGALYRVTPQAVGAPSTEIRIEKIPAEIGEAQGLVWAFDSLYAVVNASTKRKSGLYRVTSSKNDDTLDTATLLREMNGGGEHGPHAVIKHPDGKRLTVLCGNQTKMTEVASSRPVPVWGEDHLLPRMPDGRGFMKGVMGPGGAIYNVDPEGKTWELFSVGYRNPYDIAYNAAGDLFTYDADMEWDFNTPWYRPTRVCHVTSGSEYGWRNGAGKYPPYYLDNLPPVVNIGPGSPTGVTFGYDAKFPEKYRNAFFICDWSYGKLYALHMKPKGATYTAEVEEFIAGTPLPLTDVVVNPVDGAMYFAIGGRKTQSGLYRVTAESGEQAKPTAIELTPEMVARREIEDAHTLMHSRPSFAHAEENLGHADRFLRFAARVALEHRSLATVENAAFGVTQPTAKINGLLALTRVSAPCPSHRKPSDPKADPALGKKILDALNAIDFAKLTLEQRLELIRVYHVFLNRYGPPAEDGRKATLAKFEPVYPTGDRFVDGELCQVLVYLESPVAATKIVKSLMTAATQEEQIEYARALRVLKTGWTPELRQQYFGWMQKADGFRGGNSFGGFLKQIKDDAVLTLTGTEKAALHTLLQAIFDPKAGEKVVAYPTRKFVKEYKMDDLVPALEKALAGGRDYDGGRKLFAEARCSACHRYDNEGGISGPDITQAAGRFSPKDLLESILDPSKEVSDQYQNVEIDTEDGRKIVGRIVNLHGDTMHVNTNMLEPNTQVNIKSNNVAGIKPSKVSPMPTGLLDTMTENEVFDLLAYVLSRGDKAGPMFKRK